MVIEHCMGINSIHCCQISLVFPCFLLMGFTCVLVEGSQHITFQQAPEKDGVYCYHDRHGRGQPEHVVRRDLVVVLDDPHNNQRQSQSPKDDESDEVNNDDDTVQPVREGYAEHLHQFAGVQEDRVDLRQQRHLREGDARLIPQVVTEGRKHLLSINKISVSMKMRNITTWCRQ